MNFDHTPESVAKLIAKLVRATLREDGPRFIFRLAHAGDRELSIEGARLEEIIRAVQGKSVGEETDLYDDNSLEVLVREESTSPIRRLREELLKVQHDEFSYEISGASDEYLVWLFVTADERKALRDIGLVSFVMQHRIERVFADGRLPSLMDFIREMSSRLQTLKVIASSKQTVRRLAQSAYSYLFHVSYNLDVAFVPQRYFDEISRRGRITRMRRSKPEELDPPRRLYNEDLIHHYLLSVSTDSPSVQYLSYYHVLEHFFESVFNDDLIEQVKSAITHPGFSYKRKKDVGQLINSIRKALQVRSETTTFSESEALRLCLGRFVDVGELSVRLAEYEDSLMDYYRDTEVPFSSGARVDLRATDRDQVVRALARRIYVTRNALVHSKDGDKARYIPFKDERSLVKEIPLMRFIAEMVILSAADVA